MQLAKEDLGLGGAVVLKHVIMIPGINNVGCMSVCVFTLYIYIYFTLYIIYYIIYYI